MAKKCNISESALRLEKIRKLERLEDLLRRKLKRKEIRKEEGVHISNSKQENELQVSENGIVRRRMMLSGKNVIPVKKTANTIDGMPDDAQAVRMNTPDIKEGDYLKVQLIENDYWKKNKHKYPGEEWKAAPIYILDNDGNKIDLIEAFKQTNSNTEVRQSIYNALVEGKSVELKVGKRTTNFNNVVIDGSPLFMGVKENHSMNTLIDVDGNIITPTGNETKPVLIIARGEEGKATRWATGAIAHLPESIEMAIGTDLGDPRRLPSNDHLGHVFSLTLMPDGRYNKAKLSTRNLSTKQLNFVIDSLTKNDITEVRKVVGNSTKFEEAGTNPAFLSIESVKGEDKSTIWINFNSPSRGKIVKLSTEELTKGLNGEGFTFSLGKFNTVQGESNLPRFKWITQQKIVSSPSKGINPVINELKGVLKKKKVQVDVEQMNGSNPFQIKGLTKKYDTYQEYLFDEDAHGEDFGLLTDNVNNKAIVNTDIKNIDGSIFYNTHTIFTDIKIDGKSMEEVSIREASAIPSSERTVTPSVVRGKGMRKRGVDAETKKMLDELDKCGF